MIKKIKIWFLKYSIASWDRDEQWRDPRAARIIRAEQRLRRAKLRDLEG